MWPMRCVETDRSTGPATGAGRSFGFEHFLPVRSIDRARSIHRPACNQPQSKPQTQPPPIQIHTGLNPRARRRARPNRVRRPARPTSDPSSQRQADGPRNVPRFAHWYVHTRTPDPMHVHVCMHHTDRFGRCSRSIGGSIDVWGVGGLMPARAMGRAPTAFESKKQQSVIPPPGRCFWPTDRCRRPRPPALPT